MAADKGASHENLARENEVEVGSERGFGIVFAVVFTIVGLWPLTGESGQVRMWALVVAAAFLVAAFVFPAILKPLNLLWFKFGLLLHKIVNPLVMGLLFFSTVTPTALIFKLLGKDPLRLKAQPEADSYWIPRDPPGPERGGMKNQF